MIDASTVRTLVEYVEFCGFYPKINKLYKFIVSFGLKKYFLVLWISFGTFQTFVLFNGFLLLLSA